MSVNAEITIDLVLILRLLVALFFGIFYAFFIQFSQQGRYLARRLTWLAVVIGVGVDLAIAYDASWWTVVGVVAFSSAGIIARSLVAASKETPDIDLGRYKLGWIFSDIADYINTVIVDLSDILQNGALSQKESAIVSNALALAYRIENVVKAAKRGEYEQRRPR